MTFTCGILSKLAGPEKNSAYHEWDGPVLIFSFINLDGETVTQH